MHFKNTLDFARQLDGEDPLRRFRGRFYIPLVNGKESIYFTGNSLGLQPRNAQEHVLNEMENWANYGVEGHFHGRNPWVNYHDAFPGKLAPLVGALPEEIVVMNQLTVNLHLLLITFYRPDKRRFKILCEEKAFPSDRYAIESQLKLHGYNPEEALIEIGPRPGAHCIEKEDLVAAIRQHGKELSLVIMGGINYYSGQVFDMEAITAEAHQVGALCGFDLAHAVGNVELKLHAWNVDFAAWCSYKYLNSGPGSIGGAFIHQRFIADPSLLRLAGWWGTNRQERFLMKQSFDPMPTAEGWQVSNTQVLSMAPHLASLEIFEEAGFENILKKARTLSSYLLFVLHSINESAAEKVLEVITPSADKEHGCQVSLLMIDKGKEIFEYLSSKGVIADWREPNVIRIAPVPLYNTFEEVFGFGEIVRSYH